MKLIILAGGSGLRLFPLSRSCYPKQFLKVAGQASLLQQTVRRFAELVAMEDIVVVTNAAYIFHVRADLAEIGAQAAHIIAEPASRNTAPAIALAVAYCREELHCDSSECLFVTPADHRIAPVAAFQAHVLAAEEICRNGHTIVTLGVQPSIAETGYGYIRAAAEQVGAGYRVQAFTEKPNRETAERYLTDGGYYWNAGMFAFTAETMTEAFQTLAPEIASLMAAGYASLLDRFEEMPNVSIDYAVAEKSDSLVVVPLAGLEWNDVGSFDAIDTILPEQDGNRVSGDVVTAQSKNNTIIGASRLISTIGVEDLLIVDTPDVLLVSKKGMGQEVKQVVHRLQAAHRREVEENVTMYRPWGSYTTLARGEGYQVKKITVNPGAKLSLQLHYHRSEHWTVISGTGKLTLDDKEIIFRENESTYIPIAAKHRLENVGKLPLSIIEVQNGKYLGEDDIVRFDDVYGRE